MICRVTYECRTCMHAFRLKPFTPTVAQKIREQYAILTIFPLCKGNSVQEGFAKCFAVHILNFEIWPIT